MWCLRCCWWLVALVSGSVLGEPKISFHPPIYLYEFGELGDQPIHFATVGHIGPGQRTLKIDIKPFPCVLRVRFVRVVVLNAHNAPRVLRQDNSFYIQYQLGDFSRSTYIVWANRAGPRDLTCLRRVRDSAVHHRRQMVLSHMRTPPVTAHARLGHAMYVAPPPPPRAYYPTHGAAHGMARHGAHRHPADEDDDNDVQGRNADDGTSSEDDAQDSETEDSQLDDASAESSNEVIVAANKVELGDKKSNITTTQSEEQEPQWKLTRQSKNKDNNRMGSKAELNKVAVQEIADPINVTETVKIGLNTTIYRRTTPVQTTIKEEIIEEFVTPQEFVSQSTIPAGVTMIPGYTYQFINLPSSSEATAVQLPPQAVQLPPQAEIPKDQSEWEAYFKKLMTNSTVATTDMPELVPPPPTPQ